MARRRDKQTRAMRRYERQASEENGERYVSPVRGSRSFMRNVMGGSAGRAKGRRGVRARARLARIAARQPSGGTITNS